MEYGSSRRRFGRLWILAGTVVMLMCLMYAWRLQAQQPVRPFARGTGRLPALPVLAQVTDN